MPITHKKVNKTKKVVRKGKKMSGGRSRKVAGRSRKMSVGGGTGYYRSRDEAKQALINRGKLRDLRQRMKKIIKEKGMFSAETSAAKKVLSAIKAHKGKAFNSINYTKASPLYKKQLNYAKQSWFSRFKTHNNLKKYAKRGKAKPKF